jgi:protein-S-isoprenylcysteine O-methyltransferase Ste14
MQKSWDVLSGIMITIAAVGQIISSFLLYNENGSTAVTNIGWGILWLSAVFGWLPIFTLRRWGSVPRGESYMQTRKLVDKGVYAVVRHPQYLAGILLGIALTLIAQHWIVGVFGAVFVLITYVGTFQEERSCVEKFGQDYERYMESVPRLNFLAGIVRVLLRKLKT